MTSNANRLAYLITGIVDDNSLATAVADRMAADGHLLVCTGLGLTPHHEGLSDKASAFLEKTYASFETTVRDRYGDKAIVMPLDVTLDASLDEVASRLRDDGIPLAGVFHSIAMDKTIRAGAVKPLLDVTLEEFSQAMNVSAYSLIALTRSLLHHNVLRERASIVAVSYRGAEFVMTHPYKNVGVAKAALERIIRELADELGRSHRIRVNGVRFSPYTGSKAGGAIPGLAEAERLAADLSPLGNAKPADLAEEVAYLMAPETRITGDIRNVDGGYNIRG
ncbi:MAG: SDR family oxidoreductase [Myxococcota bacterium]